MVFLTRFLGYAAKEIKQAPRKYLRRGFLDSFTLQVKAGTGGCGLPKYGGIGGRGGNIYVVGTEGASLIGLKKYKDKKISGENGGNSLARGLIGAPGKDLEIPVPRGVTVYDANNAVIGEVDQDNSKLLVASGGIGGCETTGFSGQKGQHRKIVLDLKLIADVALVGFPNAGKSTMLKTFSNAKPKVADYPFTTVKPHLGTVTYDDLRQITIADLPGLIEGAHINIGMGHKFLKHLDRTKLLVFVVDIQGFRLSVRHSFRNCLETVVLLNKELELYKPDLLNMHSILIINKMDTPDADKKFKEIESSLHDLPSILDKMPEEMRPDVPLHFNEIITASLKSNNPDEINKIKERIRINLDKQAEEEFEKQQGTTMTKIETDLYEKIKRHNTRVAPTLV
ncbi:hypothetical protein HCN44_004250 [Aphidius gifuensis]|uniref:GTP-binding protein n=1 Tax=Aphidius gifuensis TaxID=684658 RepID=A0A834XYT9_APHGI|nr:hypothetical protein HCN44_004250 [Aphidius gifuensis]